MGCCLKGQGFVKKGKQDKIQATRRQPLDLSKGSTDMFNEVLGLSKGL